MKKKILILGYLLSATTFLSDVRGGTHELFGDIEQRDGRYYASFRLSGEHSELREFPLSHLQRLGYEPQLREGLDLRHMTDLRGADLGVAKERVRCSFKHNGQEQTYEGLLQQSYPLSGEWKVHADRDHNQTVYTLELKARVNGFFVDVQSDRPIQTLLAHHLIRNEGQERTGTVHFDGENVVGIRILPQLWKHPDSDEEYHHDKMSQDLNVKNHEGNDMVYVEPFSLEGQSKSRDDYRGDYVFERELTQDESIQGREEGRLIYSDGVNIYLPYVTQERWRREQTHVGFFLASYKAGQDRQLAFAQGALVPHGRLSAGLYQLSAVEDRETGRIEKWRKLGEDGNTVEISSPSGVSSIPGMGFSAPYNLVDTGALPDVTKLITGMTEVESKTSVAQLYPHAAESVLIVGPTGSGKSVLFNLLAKKQCTVTRKDGKRILDIETPVEGTSISHDQNTGTTFPVAWYDQEEDRAFIDFSGFGDQRGSAADIKNLYAFQRVVKGRQNLRILLTLRGSFLEDRSREFPKLLEDITTVFPEESQWMQSVTLIATKLRGDSNPVEMIEGIVRFFADPATRVANRLTEESYRFLQFLAVHPDRIQSMPYPEKEGHYGFEREALLEGLGRTTRLGTLEINMKVGDEARAFVGQLANGLNSHLEQYMKTEGVRNIVNYCRQKIETHSGTIQGLRNHFATMVQTLSDLTTQNADEFVRVLRSYMTPSTISEITNVIGRLRFLQGIRDGVSFNIDHWKATLNFLTNFIRDHLVAVPQVEVNEGLITVKGVVVGTSEVQAVMRAHPNYPVQIFAGNTLLLDEDVENHGRSFIAFAPHWKAIGERTIDLSGINGTNGANGVIPGENGQPGSPGGNGGHFYGQAHKFEGLPLTINVSGGNGGNGGNGVDGANGVDGTDASGHVEYKRISRDWNLVHASPFNKDGYSFDSGKKYREDVRIFYRSQPPAVAATPGQDGGKGGQGGHHGFNGSISPLGAIAITQINVAVEEGQNGTPGNGGLGGISGRVYSEGRKLHYVEHGGHKWHNKDKWEVIPQLVSQANPIPGVIPTELNSNNLANPVPQVPLDGSQLFNNYASFDRQQALIHGVAPFLSLFPSILVSPQGN